MHRLFIFLKTTVIILLSSEASHAERLIICNIGGPGSAKQAAPILGQFFHHLEQAGGLPKNSLTGTYFTNLAHCLDEIKKTKPMLGVFDLATYLKLQKRYHLNARAYQDTKNGRRYYLLVRKDSFSSLSDLKGKRLCSNHLEDLTFVDHIIFSRHIHTKRHFQLIPIRQPLQGLRKVVRGQAEATLVDEQVYHHLNELTLNPPLVSIYQSPKLPGLILATIGKLSKKQQNLTRIITHALAQLCSNQGQQICNTFQIHAFTSVDPKIFRSLETQYRDVP